MKHVLIAGLALALSATAAAAAEETWVISGGDGSSLGFDRASIAKTAAAGKTPATVSLRYGAFSTTPMPTPPALAGASLLGFVGVMAVNCQDKSIRPGEITYYFAGAGASERSIPADPRTVFEKLKPGDYRQYFVDVACTGPKPADYYMAQGRTNGLSAMRRVAATAHVTNTGGKGWTFAMGDPARLMAIDTTSTKRSGDIVVQSEINWMRKPQVTNGEPWRYLQMTFEYDCAKGRRRGSGPLRIYADDDHPVHEETVADAPWEPLAGAQAASLLEIACKNKKLAGLPVGTRSAMLQRLKELNTIQ